MVAIRTDPPVGPSSAHHADDGVVGMEDSRVAVMNATVVGAMIPFLLEQFRIDPAIATRPFITTTNDGLGHLIYLGFRSLLYA